MKTIPLPSTLALCGLLAFATPAAALDATQSITCALAEAAECDELANCNDVAVEQIAFPETLHVDFPTKLLATSDRQRTSPIHAVETLDAVLVVQGQQDGRGWTMVIDRATGLLALTIASVDGALVLSGGCTAP